MTKEDLQEHIKRFKEIYSKSVVPNRDHDKGKNIKIRKEALRKLEHNIWLLESYVRRNQGLYDFITFEGGEPYHQAIIWNEFVSIQYFMRDLSEAIEKLEKKLKEMT